MDRKYYLCIDIYKDKTISTLHLFNSENGSLFKGNDRIGDYEVKSDNLVYNYDYVFVIDFESYNRFLDGDFGKDFCQEDLNEVLILFGLQEYLI
jgi:hypothetical protein